MRWIILAICVLFWTLSAQAQNLTANKLQFLPAAPSACPTGRVCVFGTNATSPYRVATIDSSGNTVTAGDAWRLRQCSGPCPGAVNGDVWIDTGTGASYVKQNGAALPFATTVTVLPWHLLAATVLAANDYWGPIESAASTTLSPAVVPCNGTLSALFVQANAAATGSSVFTVHRSNGGNTISYSSTALTCTVGLGEKSCSDTSHIVAVTSGSLLLIQLTTTGFTMNGGSSSVRVTCAP